MNNNALLVKIYKRLSKSHWWCIIILSLILCEGINIIFSTIGNGYDFENEYSNSELLFMAFFFAPIFETIIAQAIPIEIFMAINKAIAKRRYPIFAICGSSLIFGLFHNYNVTYIIYGLLIGFIFASVYLIFRFRKHYGYGILMLCILHCLCNISTYLINHFL